MKNEDRKPVNGCLKKGRKCLNISLIWNYFHQVSTIHTVQYLFYPNLFCSFYRKIPQVMHSFVGKL